MTPRLSREETLLFTTAGRVTTKPGALALGTTAGGWAVSEVKLKRLEQ